MIRFTFKLIIPFPCDGSHSSPCLASACPYHDTGTSEFILVESWEKKAIPLSAAHEGIQPAVEVQLT